MRVNDIALYEAGAVTLDAVVLLATRVLPYVAADILIWLGFGVLSAFVASPKSIPTGQRDSSLRVAGLSRYPRRKGLPGAFGRQCGGCVLHHGFRKPTSVEGPLAV